MHIHHLRLNALFLSVALVVTACTGQPAANQSALQVNEPSRAVQVATPSTPATRLTGLPRNADGYNGITATQLRALLQHKDFTLVNVHVPYAGELPDTDLFIPFDQIQDHQAELPAKDAPLVLY